MGRKPAGFYVEVSNGNSLISADNKKRNHHLTNDEIVSLRAKMQETGKFISPYGKNRLYTFILDSLSSLGENQIHHINAVFNKFVEIASHESTKDENEQTLWERFSAKQPRNLSSARDVAGKFKQNLEVMQRLSGQHPYGLKLAQVGACIDIYMDSESQLKVCLRTNIPHGDPVKPINTSRKRQHKKAIEEVSSGVSVSV